MPTQKYHNLADFVLATARAGFELYTKWYQSQDERKRKHKKRKRGQNLVAVNESTGSCSSGSNKDIDTIRPEREELEVDQLPGRRKVGPDGSSCDENDSSRSFSLGGQQKKRPKLEKSPLRAEPSQSTIPISQHQFPTGTLVRKHFPMEGWFDGQVTKCKFNRPLNTFIYCVDYEERDGQDIATQNELLDIVRDGEPYRDLTLFTFDEYLELWEQLSPEEIEKSSAIRKANSKVDKEDAETQHNAQYGRFLPAATDTLFRVLRLQRSDIFLDVGHGIGNSCLQAAYCAGCESRGIEVVKDRYNISLIFQRRIEDMTSQADKTESRMRIPGKVVLKHGDLADPSMHNWLVGANKVFVNNFNGVFAERMVSQAATDWHLDHYIAGLFASMEVDSLMFTLSDLQLGPTRKEVNKWRVDNNLEPSPNASFFDVVKVELGEAGQVFSWSTSCKAPAYAYVYRRVKQDSNLRSATLLCCNINCEHSKKGTPIPAVALNRDGKAVVGTCECKMTLRSSRRVPLIQVADYLDPRGEYREWGL